MMKLSNGVKVVPMDATPKYRWEITKDHISGAATALLGKQANVTGPRGCDDSITDNPAKFAMHDDDGKLYYEGTIWGNYDGFEPLDDFGAPNAGCTSIDIDGERL